MLIRYKNYAYSTGGNQSQISISTTLSYSDTRNNLCMHTCSFDEKTHMSKKGNSWLVVTKIILSSPNSSNYIKNRGLRAAYGKTLLSAECSHSTARLKTTKKPKTTLKIVYCLFKMQN